MPRYSSIWDVDEVIKFLVSLGKNEELILKLLSQKLALLMALVGASRSSELAALDLRFKVVKSNGVSFRLATLTKKRTPGLQRREHLVFRQRSCFSEPSQVMNAFCGEVPGEV